MFVIRRSVVLCEVGSWIFWYWMIFRLLRDKLTYLFWVLGAFAKCEKWLFSHACVSVRPSVRTHRNTSASTECIVMKFEKIRIWLKNLAQRNLYFTWGPMHVRLMRQNMIQHEGTHIIWSMRFACWRTKAANSQSEFLKSYCFSMATMMIKRRRLNVNVCTYVHRQCRSV